MCLVGLLCCLFRCSLASVFQFARQFYVAQWYHDCTIEVDKAAKKLAEAKKGDQKRRKKKPDSEDDDDGPERLMANAATTEMETMKMIQGKVEMRKAFLLGQVLSKARNFATFRCIVCFC